MKYFYETKSDNYQYNVGAEFNNEGKLLISDWALGDIIKETHIDSDIEHYVIIDPKDIMGFITECCKEKKHELPKSDLSEEKIIDLLFEIFEGESRAIFEIKDILKKNKIPYEFQYW